MKKFLKLNVIIMLLATLFYFGLYGYAKIIKKIDIKKENNYYMYDNNEELFNISDDWVKLDDISEYLINATISIEDKNIKQFYMQLPEIFKMP
jgi:membrane peptidoglycan carboxypeptidase